MPPLSEGVSRAFPRIPHPFRSISTTAANHGKRCRCGMGPNGEYGSGRPVEGGTTRQTYHNGSKSRETLPVRNGPNGEYGSERLVEGGTARQTYHNGSKSRKMLPMQKPRNMITPPRGTSRAIPVLHPLLQRHRITPNAAVAEISRIVNLFHLINDFTANLP